MLPGWKDKKEAPVKKYRSSRPGFPVKETTVANETRRSTHASQKACLVAQL
jgi:hypothetical protein